MSEPPPARPSLYPLVVPVCVVGLATVVAAAVSFATATHGITVLAGLAAFLGASLLADRFPVPVDDLDASGVSLAFVFGLATIVLFGWAAGVLVVFATPAVMPLLDRRPPIRIAYNSFARVEKQFFDLILKAQVGVVDAAWTQKKERTDAITALENERRAQLKALQDEFSEVLKEVK